MSRILVTGARGRVGSAVMEELRSSAMEGLPFDRVDGQDALDPDAVRDAARGCTAIAHVGAIPSDGMLPAHETVQQNVGSTFVVLDAARELGIGRIVFVSSIQATGVSLSHRDPDYLPLDDDHPSYARTPYALSKVLGEQLCARYTHAYGIVTICLRPPTVLAPEEYEVWAKRRREIPEAEDPAWTYGAWIDSRDLAAAIVAALTCPDPGHITLLVSADDVSSNRPGREVIEELYPRVEWRGGREHDDDLYRSLVDVSRARALLGWTPRHRWDAVRAEATR